MDNREYNAAIYNTIYNDTEWGSPELTKQYIDTRTKYIPFSDKDLKRWEDFKVKFPNQAHTYQYAANELGVPVQALFREGNDVVGAYLKSIPYTDNIMHRFYEDPRGLDKRIPRTKISKEQMLKASKSLGKTAKNIVRNIEGGPLLNAAIATPFIANALFNPAYANNRGEEVYNQATNFIAPVGAYEGLQGQGGGFIPALGGFFFGPDVSNPLKQNAITGAYADRYTRFNLDTPEAAEAYRQTRPKRGY